MFIMLWMNSNEKYRLIKNHFLFNGRFKGRNVLSNMHGITELERPSCRSRPLTILSFVLYIDFLRFTFVCLVLILDSDKTGLIDPFFFEAAVLFSGYVHAHYKEGSPSPRVSDC